VIRAIEIKPASSWSGAAADAVVLGYDDRHRRRLAMTGSRGVAFLLDLPAAAELRGGDALVLEDGRLIEVLAAPEPLLEIRCTDPLHLARVAWHLGNRHLPTQLVPGEQGGRIRIREDHVIRAMVEGLGGRCTDVSAPFDPEGGAYAGLGILAQAGHGPAHGHHHHDHD